MKFVYRSFILLFVALCLTTQAQRLLPTTQETLDKLDALQRNNQSTKAIPILDAGIATTTSPKDLAYLYAYKSSIYATMDSLLIAKRLIDQSMHSAKKSKESTAIAIAYRAKAFLDNAMNLPDSVVKDALQGLKFVENDDNDLETKYHLNYLLYGAYSKWDDADKMQFYIRRARYYALKKGDINLQVNVNNGFASMYLALYRKNMQLALLDSSFQHLENSFALQQQHPTEVSGNTFVITCVNLANYYLDFSKESLSIRTKKAFEYLQFAEEKLNRKEATAEKWMNVLGIKSGFAKKQGNFKLAEQYLVQGLSKLMSAPGSYYKLEYSLNKELADLAHKQDDITSALIYQRKAEELLKKSFDEQQLFNVQKLEVQYETARKDQELALSKQREDFRRRQNYLYGGIAVALTFGLVFMFASYHFKLRYSIEREKKLAKEKEDAHQQAQMQLLLEREEQARLKSEQELLDLRKQQLEKEALANSLIIDRKNETFKQIQDKIEQGQAAHIPKLLKEEMLMQSDFEDIKMQVKELHPDFFKRLTEKSVQKLTPLDLRYCTYLYLKMSTKQIAQTLHIEPQSVRMFKYRLKQKFGLEKDHDLEDFLAQQ